MQLYYFYRHAADNVLFVSTQPHSEHQLEFLWIDSCRQDLVNQADAWQQQVYQYSQLQLNEFHIQDLLNIEHPCVFDTVEEYDLLIFRKLIGQDDQVLAAENNTADQEALLGLATTPMGFIFTAKVLISVREEGNTAVENYIKRLALTMQRSTTEPQLKMRKLPATSVDLVLRLLNSMVDDYLALRTPLMRRVEYWQQQLLQGNRRFKQWHQLFHENMLFQHIENLCEEQIEALQEFQDELSDNYSHVVAKKTQKNQDMLRVRLNDLISHVERVQKQSIRLGTAIQSAIDLHFSAIANQTNENMRILAIITAVFAPLTLLTGIYGMNFEFIPGLESPLGFWLMLLVMVVTTLLLLYYFYRQHLLGRGERSVIDLLAQHPKQRRAVWFLDEQSLKKALKDVEKMTRFKR